MFDEQFNELASIVKNDDLKKYVGDAFLNLIQAVISKDPVSGTLTAKDVQQIVFHMPTVIFWDKIKRFLQGTYKNYDEQVKMASRFNEDTKKYVEFVKKQIYLIDKLEDDMKVDCFAMLTRCLLLQEIEISLYFKIAQIINQCTPFELKYIRKIGINEKQKNSAIVSSLYRYGLVEQASKETEVYYILSGFGKALKGDCLNYGDDAKCKVVKTYNDVFPLSISEPILKEDMEQIYHYGCPECKNTDEPYIIKAATEKKPLMKHSLASPSSVAWTIYQKYATAMPLYRQEKDWKQYGIELSRTTLANWIIYCSKHYFSPLYEFFHRKLLERYFLMADETPVQVLNEPGRRAQTKSYMWVYRTGEDGLPPIILYGYSETRAGDNAKNFLNGFKGYLECDGYQGYNKVPDIKRCSCWAHVRRYLIDAIPKGRQSGHSQSAERTGCSVIPHKELKQALSPIVSWRWQKPII